MKITLEAIASIRNLSAGWEKVLFKKSTGGIDGETVESFQNNAESNLQKLSEEILSQRYIPEPLAHGLIKKSGKPGVRELGLPSVRDKIVQNVIAEQFIRLYDPKFSNCSYAYRAGKGNVKAIGRVKDFLLKKNYWITTVDIDDFFDNINHTKCIEILKKNIHDPRVLRLIRLYLSTGIIKKNRWKDNIDGVPQGGVISPVLSNIYLNEFDQFLHSINADFVRFSDDFIIFGKSREQLQKKFELAKTFLKDKLFLSLNYIKSPLKNTSQGFAFLGIFFHKGKLAIEVSRFNRKVKNLEQIIKSGKNPQTLIKKINTTFSGIERYYARLLPDAEQLHFLENSVIKELIIFVSVTKEKGVVKTKQEWRLILTELRFFKSDSRKKKEQLTERIINDGFEIYKSNKTAKQSVESSIGRKRQKYAKKITHETELVVSKFGHYLGFTKNQFTVKYKGQIMASVPKNKLQRIIINSKGISISSNLIKECSALKISIEFISFNGEPYALLYTPESGMARSYELQLKVRGTQECIYLSQCFIRGKAKNQINLLKYFNKYLKKTDKKNSALIVKNIAKMKIILEKIINQSISDKESKVLKSQLMGFEGSISSLYWSCLGLIVPETINFKARIKRNAKDVFNSSINYGYGILYNRIQKSLVDAGAALTVSFLHEPSGSKPTLVFDMIEEFRQFIVDRSIVAMFNKKEPLNTDSKGWLTAKARQLVMENIQERLGSYIIWRKKKWKCEDIIQHQSRLLMHHLNGEKRYKPFIGRY